MSQAPDHNVRQEALNPRRSFIVQAPAGSGKTELLTQRYLVLLAHVERAPEEIVAITFTKKAAAEMRERIIKALTRGNDPTPPTEPHLLHAWRLAQQVLVRDAASKWDLLHNTHRLRITTIDSLCASLTQQLPILARFGAQPEVSTETAGLYQAAVRDLLKDLDERCDWSYALAKILLHLDNRIDVLEKLLVHMLSNREQWLDVLPLMQREALRLPLEQALVEVVEESLHLAARHVPQAWRDELLAILRFAWQHLMAEGAVLPDLDPDEFEASMLNPQLHDLSFWLWLKEILQTAKGEWRKSLTKLQGFLPESSGLSVLEKQARKDYKARALTLLETFEAYPDFKLALGQLQFLPPLEYSDQQWDMVEALLQILPVLVAHLQLVFAAEQTVDFNEIALAALKALGDEEAPTELALALDYQIRHLLVDEFQDTSQLQYRLLLALSRGWQSGDGRSLFLVGDPMQSIYRFRQADVGLFIQVKEHGLGDIPLEYLRLEANFRSTPGIIDWVNHSFKQVFAPMDDPVRGAISYSPSIAVKPQGEADAVRWHFLFNSTEEVEARNVLETVRYSLSAYPDDNIAILVRSRTALTQILPTLQKANIAYQAVDIESLSDRALIQDLFALCSALNHLADRLAWLSILRAPWSGMSLADLKLIADAAQDKTIWQALHQPLALSVEGSKIVARIRPILAKSLTARGNGSLRAWVEQTWWALGGPIALSYAIDIKNAELFFGLLQECELAGRLPSPLRLKQRLETLKAQTQTAMLPKVQVMTIHKAKGLEFDTVIIPGLSRSARAEESALLLWQERVNERGQHRLLLAPIKSVGAEANLVYQFLALSEKDKAKFEAQRLLYVAVTRAKKRLHLIASIKIEAPDAGCKKPAAGSLLAHLWPVAEASCQALMPEALPLLGAEAQIALSSIKRLPPDSELPARCQQLLQDASPLMADLFDANMPEPYVPEAAVGRAVGTVAHRYLAEMVWSFVADWTPEVLLSKRVAISAQLRALGILPMEITEATERVIHILLRTISDPRGQWILKNHHASMAEFALFADAGRGIQKWIIDRSFVDETGQRWIIDYKSSSPQEHEALKHFLEREKQQYLGQLNQYARLLAMKYQLTQLSCGLYFPAVDGGWISWEWTVNSR